MATRDELGRRPWWGRIVWTVGGFYDTGRLSVCIHDRGIDIAWDRILRKEWKAP